MRHLNTLTLIALAVICSLAYAGAAAKRPPNVLIILTDDQGYGDLGLHGNDRIKTPNLDRLGRESVRLTRFYVSPVCAPTRASLMTGRYNYRTGVVDTYLGRAMMYPDEVTLAELLRGAGYRTGIFGKWHLGDNYPLRAVDQGFQEALVCTGGGLTQPSDPPGNTYFDPVLQHNGRPEKRSGYCTDIFTSAAIDFIERNRSRPFFAYLPTNAPHEPLQIDEKYVAPYRAAGLDETTARVYGMVASIDENVGRLLARLKELGLEENTLVLFMTDNGPQHRRYAAGFRGRKGTVYEGGIHVPCFARWPAGFSGSRTVDRIVAHIDILPTVLEACGVRKPADLTLDGRSLLPLLRGEAAGWPERTLFFQWHRGDAPIAFRSAAAMTQRYKLVDGRELYDLPADPGETRDLSAQHPEIVQHLRREYDEWFRDVASTRGYEPPRIVLGSKHQDPVTLTRQDWRGPRAGWNADSLGYWEVAVARLGRYDVTLRFPPPKDQAEVHLRLGGAEVSRPVGTEATSCRFGGVRLPKGPARLEAWVAIDATTTGVHYVDVSRSSSSKSSRSASTAASTRPKLAFRCARA